MVAGMLAAARTQMSHFPHRRRGHKDILVDIISGKIDTVQLARMEMWNRGLDMKTGKWIGWRKGDDSYQVA